ncbi:hypothetical protein BUL40_10835 [Croceivirga radicis]|uniref:Competence protein n=1 Tax=Croceivirga radicis TaxID=1929488 RepID=A0A1V6LR29_9FLAO|nr:hypothetical protein [Croceivirga radicis]OQD42416.1 hypothetical protein BUL40_10835 [Croceivirga radicis]
MDKKLGTITSESIDNSQELIENSWEYYKLKLFYHTSEISISFIKYFFVGMLSLLALLFLSVSMALFIGQGLDNSALGYLIVGGFYVLLGLVALPLKKWLEKTIIKKLSKTILRDE